MENIELEKKARKLRRSIIKMLDAGRAGHPSGSLSVVEILTVLFYKILRLDPKNPLWPDRDRFILSKGHAAPALYAVLGDLGFFSEDHFSTFDHIDSILQGHPDRTKTPGVEISTGSLGQGLSAGIGMALSAQLDGKSYRTFVLLGDGELQSGQVWEAAMFAGYKKLENLVAIVDNNKQQLSGWTKDILDIEPLVKKWEAFRWDVTETDGHDLEKLLSTFRGLEKRKAGAPALVVAHTTKGKGVSFMENRVEWHAKPMTDEEVAQALAELK